MNGRSIAEKMSPFMRENDNPPSTSISSAIMATESGRRSARGTIHTVARCLYGRPRGAG